MRTDAGGAARRQRIGRAGVGLTHPPRPDPRVVYRQRHARLGDLPAHRSRLRAGVDEPKSTSQRDRDRRRSTVLAALRAVGGHRFLADDVSLVDDDVPLIVGYRQVTDAHLLTLARRRGVRLVTFDAGVFTLAQQRPKTPVELLTIL